MNVLKCFFLNMNEWLMNAQSYFIGLWKWEPQRLVRTSLNKWVKMQTVHTPPTQSGVLVLFVLAYTSNSQSAQVFSPLWGGDVETGTLVWSRVTPSTRVSALTIDPQAQAQHRLKDGLITYNRNLTKGERRVNTSYLGGVIIRYFITMHNFSINL